MGPAYAAFDAAGRRAPRLPGPPYHFVTRIRAVDGAPGAMRSGTTVTAEYDAPADAWYFAGRGEMPLGVLMEVALQPCGWLAMYLGSVLESTVDLLFRNLDGTATVHRNVLSGTEKLHTRVVNREISRYGGVIIESFAVTVTTGDGELVFEADTVFGFFPPASFGEQPGLPPSTVERERFDQPATVGIDLGDRTTLTGYEPDGGGSGLGWLRATRDIDPDDWYFKAHFFQDPVQPGSFGVQLLADLLRWYLTRDDATARVEWLPGHPLTWKYRGQVVPTDGRLTVELEITATDGRYALADGWLWIDDRRIYHVTGLALHRVDGELSA
jgi:3-hydroxymyristoyl/3-hydroxydecanoyl-(acyl carrier protein) dehydratase